MMNPIPFEKVHGCGNDFVLVDRSRLNADQAAWLSSNCSAGFIRRLCDRRTGIGADGVLLLDRDEAGWAAQILNADGSDGGMCGNGLRCIALSLVSRGCAGPNAPIPVRMGGRTTALGIDSVNPFRASLDLGRVLVGQIDEAPEVDRQCLESLACVLDAHAVAVAWAGNPHAAICLEAMPASGDDSIARTVRSSGLFPGGVNVTVAVRMGRRHLRAMTDERGVGPTPACASGAGALVASLHRMGMVEAQCEVEMPGGTLSVEASPDPLDGSSFAVRIAGAAEISFRGEIPISTPKSPV